jgi:membrane protein
MTAMASVVDRFPRWRVPGLRIVVATVERFYADRCLEAAAALTYTSLLSLVPLFALMFAVLKGLGAQHRLEPLLLSRLSLDPDVTTRMLEWIDHTNVGTIGALGAVFLIFTVISVLGSIESIFNMVWRVPRGRTWWRKVTDYVSVVLLIPFLLLLAVGLTSAVRQQTVLQELLAVDVLHGMVLAVLRLAPIAMNVVALAILYAVMPNRRPHPKSIAIAALLAGCAWQLVQVGYVSLQIGVARANAIYGALAQLPVTLVWIYVSWSVVLGGAQLAAVIEYGPEAEGKGARDVSRWAVALHVLVHAAERFRRGAGPVELGVLAHELDVDSEVVSECVAKLCDAGMLAAIDDAKETYVLARDPETIALTSVAEQFGGACTPTGADPRVVELLSEIDERRHDTLAQRTIADLLAAGPAESPSAVAREPEQPLVARSAAERA